MASRFTIVGLGEALYDIFPDKRILGGAPLNMAVHAHQLAQPHGGQGVVVSRIGQDDLGQAMVADLAARGMTTSYLQHDPDRPTGKVYVGTDAQGQPEYDIVRNVAWDWLQFDFDIRELAGQCEAVCFGTLAQRFGQTRNTIYRFLDAARPAIRLFDVNLRQQFYDRAVIHRGCELSTVVKLNDAELPIVASLLGLGTTGATGGFAGSATVAGIVSAQAQALMKRYNLRLVALTRGQAGTVLFTPQGIIDAAPVSYPPGPGADAVGAGDACAAALLVGMVLRWPWEKTLQLANHAGAFVASQPGATPKLPDEILKLV